MKGENMLKRLFAFVLAMVLMVGAIPANPVHVHATEAEEMVLEEPAELVEETTEATEETTEVTEETTEATEETTEVTEETTEATEETTEATEETTEATEETTEATEETTEATEETTEATEKATEATEGTTEATEETPEATEETTEATEPSGEELEVVELEPVVVDPGLSENEELFAGYVEQQFYGEAASFGILAGSRLTGTNKKVYDALVPFLKQIADGTRTSTKISIGEKCTYQGATYTPDVAVSFTDKNLDLGAVVYALLADLPYDLYWYDKTAGCSPWTLSYSTRYCYMEFRFNVADNYRNGTNDYQTNSAMTGAARTAAANARAVVSQYAYYSDYDKLVAYKNWLCNAVSYDHDAANNGYFSTYIDPWQMISAFDNNPNTNIVCEGYSKAFMYLCDMSTFQADVSCYTVSGYSNGGRHMWNIVSIDGINYMADVTNSDSGSVGQNGGLFLVGTYGSVTGGYTFLGVQFVYYDTTISTYGSGSDSILKLASFNYTPHTHNYSWTVLTAPTCTTAGARYGTCTICGATTDTETLAAYGHDYVNGYCSRCGAAKCVHQFVYSSTQTKATCVATGVDIHKCKKCGETKTVTTDKDPDSHTYEKTTVKPTAGKKGYDLYTCSGCGKSYKKNYKDALGLSKPTVKDYVLANSGKPYLTIKPVSGAEKYYVYRATSKSGKYKYIGSTKKTREDSGYYFYEDTKASVGKTYYYKVKAATDDVKSSYSSVKSVRCICAQPVLSKWYVSSSSGKLKMKWSKVSGAKKYEIYRASSENGTYKKIKTTTSTSFTDSTGKVGKTYWYKLKAIASSSKNNSTMDYAMAYYGHRICAKADLSVKVGSNGYPYLKWDAVSGAAKYEVYRFNDAAGTSGEYLGYTTGTSCYDYSAEFGQTYYYGVRVKGSTEKTDNGLTVDDLVKLKVTCAKPSVSVKLSSNKPKLSWKAIPVAQKYEIYRATSKSGKYTKIASTTDTYYRDKKAKKGKTYYYKVKAIGPISGTNSSYSSVDKIKSK